MACRTPLSPDRRRITQVQLERQPGRDGQDLEGRLHYSRARALDPIRSAFEREPGLSNLLLDTDLGGAVAGSRTGFMMTLSRAAGWGIPMPAHAASLAYFDSYRSARLPQNLTQAQRDAFGAHRYERIDRPGDHHTEW